jgi:hypothetical protein
VLAVSIDRLDRAPGQLLGPAVGAEARMVEREWLPLQRQFAAHSRRGTWRVVPGSDHLIGSSQPQAVAGAVLDMVAEVRRAYLTSNGAK